jgi:hypothetical protein
LLKKKGGNRSRRSEERSKTRLHGQTKLQSYWVALAKKVFFFVLSPSFFFFVKHQTQTSRKKKPDNEIPAPSFWCKKGAFGVGASSSILINYFLIASFSNPFFFS